MSDTLDRPRSITIAEAVALAPNMTYGEALYLHSRGAFAGLAASQAQAAADAALPPLWTLRDVARFLRIEELPDATVRQRLADLRRDRHFPAPVVRGGRGGNTRYDPRAIAEWLAAQRPRDAAAPPPPAPVAPAAPAPALDFNTAALRG